MVGGETRHQHQPSCGGFTDEVALALALALLLRTSTVGGGGGQTRPPPASQRVCVNFVKISKVWAFLRAHFC
jgi:hypothetical protein